MINGSNGKQELERVNMLLRALSDEMADLRTNGVGEMQNALQQEMEQAIYELKVRKLMFSALVGSNRAAQRAVRH
jgi:hypothetical protein